MHQLSECFSSLQSFKSSVEVQDPQTQPAFTKHFASAISLMESLTCLTLDFGTSTGLNRLALFFGELVQSVRLPCLVKIDLMNLACYVRDLTYFLVKHARTLTKCLLTWNTTLEVDATTAVRGLAIVSCGTPPMSDACRRAVVDTLKQDGPEVGYFDETMTW
jgi:hypothetical protein